jgi:hypothetical protein
MESVLLDTMFDLPSLEGVEEVISKQVADGTRRRYGAKKKFRARPDRVARCNFGPRPPDQAGGNHNPRT